MEAVDGVTAVKVFLLGGPFQQDTPHEIVWTAAGGAELPVEGAESNQLWIALKFSKLPMVQLYRNFIIMPNSAWALFYHAGEKSPEEFE